MHSRIGSHMTYSTRGITNQTDIFLLELRTPSRSMACASLSYGGINFDNSASEKPSSHIARQRNQSGMTHSDWIHPPGIASMRSNSGATPTGSQSIDNSWSARQLLNNEARVGVCEFGPSTITARRKNSEPVYSRQKRSNLFSSLRSRGFPTDLRHDRQLRRWIGVLSWFRI